MDSLRVAVIGGGITGLAAALRLRDALPGAVITVIEQAREVGGKLRTTEVGGLVVEAAAEQFLVRRPEAADLAQRLGLDLVHPRTLSAAVAIEGRLRPLPTGTVMGIPPDAERLEEAGLLSVSALARVRGEPDLPGEPLTEDVSVGDYAASRLGAQLVDRLIDPLLGGVYAGRAYGLSLQATVPTLVAPLRAHPSLLRAVRATGSGTPKQGPVFASVRGGVGLLAAATARASGARIRFGEPVRELRRTPTGWQLVIGSTRAPDLLEADAVVLAVPATPAARLLADVTAQAATEVAAIEYASVALVTLVLPPTGLPAGSGALIAASAGLETKAVTYVGQKWGTGAPEATVLRASLGRFGAERVLQRDDAELIELVRGELGTLLGPLPDPRAAAVFRWGGALPQYAVGHLDRVRRARSALPSGLAIAGAAYDGVGIPACIASGQAAADEIVAALRARAEPDQAGSTS